MFVEVNRLKALIIDIVESRMDELEQWKNITENYQCVFLLNSVEELELYERTLSNNVLYILKGSSLILKTVNNAISLLGVNINEVAYVTNSYYYLGKLLGEPIGTILLTENFTYDQIGSMPDLYAADVNDLEKTLNRYPGYFGEVYNTIINNDQQLGSSGKVFSFEFLHKDITFNVISLGRYFSPKHHKHRLHQLSHRIRKSKLDESQNDLFYQSILSVLQNKKIDGITRVPPRPDDSKDRLAPIVKRLCENQNLEDLSNNLFCKENFPKQKEQINSEERRINVSDKFGVSGNVMDKEILLIDDIFTTGATVGECAYSLMSQGAKRVIILVLAVNQFDIQFSVRRELSCPNNCGGTMQLRLNKKTIGAFFGCTNFFNKTCSNIIGYKDGWRRLNSLNVIEYEDGSEIDYELEF